MYCIALEPFMRHLYDTETKDAHTVTVSTGFLISRNIVEFGRDATLCSRLIAIIMNRIRPNITIEYFA